MKMSDLPTLKTPVLARVKGVWRIIERRWEQTGPEDTWGPGWYWDDPFNDGQDIDKDTVTEWQHLPI